MHHGEGSYKIQNNFYIITYKERHAVECIIGKLNHYRKTAPRYEKKAIDYTGTLLTSWSLLWFR
jgi:transposase